MTQVGKMFKKQFGEGTKAFVTHLHHHPCEIAFCHVSKLIRPVLLSGLFFNNIACTTNINDANTTAGPVVLQDKAAAAMPTDNPHEGRRKTEQKAVSREKIADAQQNLNILGYDPGNFDGEFTSKTQMALKAFQTTSGIPVTSELDSATRVKLENAVQSKRKPLTAGDTLVSPIPSVLENHQQQESPENEPSTTTVFQDELSTPSTQSTSFFDIQAVGVHRVAAKLAEIGYFHGSITQATLEEVKTALKSFQQDIKVAASGILDDMTWEKLQNVKLSRAKQAELEAVSTTDTPIIVTPSQPQPAKAPVVKPKRKLLDPTLPVFALTPGDTVFAIESIECKSQYEALVLFYQGELQQVQNGKVQVSPNERYAMWYDIRREGVSKTDWWCIPRKRFCYSSIAFSDWGGKLKAGEASQFKKTWTIPSHLDMTALAAKSAKQACPFSDTAQATPPKKKPLSQSTLLPNNWPQKALTRIISKNHYLRPKLADVRAVSSQITNVESLNHHLNQLDPYSKYLTAKQYAFYQKRWAQKQTGLGLNILVNGENMLAVPIHRGPAYKAGLKEPRYLITLNRKKIVASDFSSFSFLTQLSSGTKIPLLVSNTPQHTPSPVASHLDNGNPEMCQDCKSAPKTNQYVVRVAPFKNPSVEYLKAGKLRLIRVHKFDDRDTTKRLKAFVLKALKQGKDIIIDLRYCPGGSLFAAIDAVSLFVPPDLEVSYLSRTGYRKPQPFVSLPGRIVKNQNIYVWVSPFTASSAEVFGRILQHYAQNAVIVGTKTKGKCLSQQVFEFDDGSALQLSVFEIFGADKLPCEGIGMNPDVEIPRHKILNNQYIRRVMKNR
ncbi:MAG: hypothetical protein DRR19_27420 [Candidatus Parabeggiatoa sp. nov. 1]|nr:MAG: hypothetical protein DRR19_27420 [Gammaproteobacteria bacterium]